MQNADYTGMSLFDDAIAIKTRPGEPGYLRMGSVSLEISVNNCSPEILYSDTPGSYQGEFGLTVTCKGRTLDLYPGTPDYLGRILEWYFVCSADGEKYRFKIAFYSISDESILYFKKYSAHFKLDLLSTTSSIDFDMSSILPHHELIIPELPELFFQDKSAEELIAPTLEFIPLEFPPIPNLDLLSEVPDLSDYTDVSELAISPANDLEMLLTEFSDLLSETISNTLPNNEELPDFPDFSNLIPMPPPEVPELSSTDNESYIEDYILNDTSILDESTTNNVPTVDLNNLRDKVNKMRNGM